MFETVLSTLNKCYLRANEFAAEQHEKLSNVELPLHDWNPFFKKPIHKHDPILERIIKKLRKKLFAGLVFVGIGIGVRLYVLNRLLNPKKPIKPRRRVPKLENGARKDVVVVVGSPTEPLTRLILLDFEKRGFIVYLTILDQKDLKYIETNPITDDINYINFADSYLYDVQLTKFKHLLSLPVIPFAGADPHKLNLKAVVFTPNLYFPVGPIESITVASWNRLNDRLLVYFKLFASGLIDIMRSENSKTILITTNIISSLNMPYHAPESIFQNSLKHLFATLHRELKHQGLSVTQMKLGNLNINNNQQGTNRVSTIINSEIRGWNEDLQRVYADDFSKSEFSSNPIRVSGKGSSLRELYHALFDIIYGNGNPAVMYCGTGARSYDIASVIIPEWLVEMLVG